MFRLNFVLHYSTDLSNQGTFLLLIFVITVASSPTNDGMVVPLPRDVRKGISVLSQVPFDEAKRIHVVLMFIFIYLKITTTSTFSLTDRLPSIYLSTQSANEISQPSRTHIYIIPSLYAITYRTHNTQIRHMEFSTTSIVIEIVVCEEKNVLK
uniref:Uncharacterized protein n=1 Tax=Glossina austeni TaxID=7395 RepID=A0A1A9VP03_GLOAU